MSKNKEVTGHIQWSRMLKKLNPYTIRKGLRYFKHYGPKEFWIRLHERFEPEAVPYGPWYEAYIPDDTELEKQRKYKFSYSPLISVAVPAFRTPEVFLRQMIDSLLAQTYSNWELCIANGSPEDKKMQAVLDQYTNKDSRIRVKILDQNLGIAGNTNAALEMTQGEYAGILDHDDLLAPNALYEIARYLENDPEADGVYTDEDKVTTELDEHFQPHLKPDFNLDLLRSNNYICHFFVVRQSIIRKVGGFRQEFDGAQDHDFIFRCVEEAGRIGKRRQRITLQAKCMRLKQEDARSRHILREWDRRELSHTHRISAFFVCSIRYRAVRWYPLSFRTKMRRNLWKPAFIPLKKRQLIRIMRYSL